MAENSLSGSGGSGSLQARQVEINEKSRWLGTLAHELRTPLAGMRVLAEYLLSDDLSDADKDPVFLQSLHSQIINMSVILENLLELAQQDNASAAWGWSEFRPREVAENAADAVRPLVDHARVEFHIEVTPDDLCMKGDAIAVGRLITNLLRNAQKHTREGVVHLIICAVPECKPSMIAIVVSDTGEGIAADLMPRLGGAFVSGESGGDWRKNNGAGLGLNICNRIVAAHGGSMFIASSPGHGTQVTVHLRADLSAPIQPY